MRIEILPQVGVISHGSIGYRREVERIDIEEFAVGSARLGLVHGIRLVVGDYCNLQEARRRCESNAAQLVCTLGFVGKQCEDVYRSLLSIQRDDVKIVGELRENKVRIVRRESG